MNETKYMKVKKWLNGIAGVAMMVVSIIFSRNGFGFSADGNYWWVGWVMAVSATAAQFMLNSDWRKINATILLVALPAYVYSMYTNILGFYAMRGGTGNVWDILNVCGGIFMDVYPEIAISWALGESKLGDMLGNLLNLWNNPQTITAQSGQKQVPVDNARMDAIRKSQEEARRRIEQAPQPRTQPAAFDREPTYHSLRKAPK